MSELFNQFKSLTKNQPVSSELLVPLLIWCSGDECNIHLCQQINKQFKYVHKEVLAHCLSLKNTLTKSIKYPKKQKMSKTLIQFFEDVGRVKKKSLKQVLEDDKTDVINNKDYYFRILGYNKKEQKSVNKVLGEAYGI